MIQADPLGLSEYHVVAPLGFHILGNLFDS
jgi:hypothetical protein